METVIGHLEFNAHWAIVLWMQVLLVPYGVWFNPTWKGIASAVGAASVVSALAAAHSIIQGFSVLDVLTLREVTSVGRAIVGGYGLVLAALLVALAKVILAVVFGRTDERPPYLE